MKFLIPQETARTRMSKGLKAAIDANFDLLLTCFMEEPMSETRETMRIFESGATRGAEEGKLDYEGFFSPLVLERYAQYLHKHRVQADGAIRASDNWTQGIPKTTYIKSAWRHFHSVWMHHKGYPQIEGIEDSLCAVAFNILGYLFEVLHEQDATGKARYQRPIQAPKSGSDSVS